MSEYCPINKIKEVKFRGGCWRENKLDIYEIHLKHKNFIVNSLICKKSHISKLAIRY
jgi:hypothetical protein